MRQTVFGKSVQGASHIRSGTECQDSYKKRICEDGTIILAVADGHGSQNCPYSHTGSKVAVNVFCDILKGLFDGYAGHQEQFLSYLNREGDTTVSRAIDSEWKRRVLMRHKKNKRPIPRREDGSEDLASVYRQYGSTLLGLLIAREFIFAFQLGDGDICCVDSQGLEQVITPDKILGVETHSLSREKSWEKAVTVVRRMSIEENLPLIFTLSSDGYANSYRSEAEFHSAVKEYLALLMEHGAKAVEDSLPGWLSEVSEMGCGDDITMVVACFMPDPETESENPGNE